MLKERRIQIQNFADWHVNGTEFNADKIIAHWLSDEEKALRDGYAGLRVSANAEVMTPAWGDLMAYEKAAHAHFQSRRILALCAYGRDNCQASHVFEVIRTHLFTLCPRDDLWEMLEANLPASRDHLDDFLEPHNALAGPPQKFK
jgi:MEDS: MEthanogen/methylotroph, DcmR Sensory domain